MENRQQRIVSLISFLCISLTLFSIETGNTRHVTHDKIGEAIYNLKKDYEQNSAKGDTINSILILNELGQVYSQQAKYAEASDYLWEALILADEINDSASIALVHEGIGWLYSFYLRNNEAFKYYNSTISIRKQLFSDKKISAGKMVSAYYNMIILHREIGDIKMCEAYLDSCYQILYSDENNKKISNYILTEQAFLNINSGEFEKGIQLLNSTIDWFDKNAPSYLIVLYAIMGDAYFNQMNYRDSRASYEKALEYSDTYSNHINYRPIIYEQLSKVYFNTGNAVKAYQFLGKSKQANEELFDSRSYNNKSLLEITDDFKKAKLTQKQMEQNQLLNELEHDARIRLYRNVILSGAVFILFVLGLILYRFIKVKHKTEREIAQNKRNIERNKNLELIDIKNKELTTSALQLAEKDKHLAELKKSLFDTKKEPELSELKKIFKKITLNSNSYWKEFEHRFIEVNEEFYKALKKQYPNLTPGDLKLCALVKLNFSSKDMSNILGISVESVHSLRYRLRKKMGLTRADNLFEHLFSIGEGEK